MGKFVLNPAFLPDVEARTVRGLTRTANRGRDVAKPLTPVLTGYAQRSVHAVVMDSTGQVAGDTVDDNGNTILPYDPVKMPTAIVGSNTWERPDQTSPGDGYYIGLELGILSNKGSNMLATAFTEMANTVLGDIQAEMT